MGIATGMSGGAAGRHHAPTPLIGDLDRSHSINAGTVFCLGAHPAGSQLLGRELISRRQGTLLGSGALTGTYAATGWSCFESTSTTADGIYWSKASDVGMLNIGNVMTIFVYMDVDALGGSGMVLNTCYFSQVYTVLQCFQSTTARLRVNIRNQAEAVQYHISANNTYTTGLHSFAITRAGGAGTSYRDGSVQTPVADTWGSDAIRWAGATLPFVLFNERTDTPANGVDGRAFRVQMWNRVLSGAEIASLHADPTLGLYVQPPPPAGIYVATDGSDGSGDGTITAPYATIAHAVSVATRGADGDASSTIIVRGGTYNQSVVIANNNGTSWTNALWVKKYPGETAIIAPSSGFRVVQLLSSSYMEFKGLIIDGTNISSDCVDLTYTGAEPTWAHHLRFNGCEIRNAPGSGVAMGQGAGGPAEGGFHELLYCNIHDNGNDDLDHGVYASVNDVLIQGCVVSSNAGWGIHAYDPGDGVKRLTVNACTCNDNAQAGARGVGIGLETGAEDCILTNNTVSNNNVGVRLGGVGGHTVSGNLVNNNNADNPGSSQDRIGFLYDTATNNVSQLQADNTATGNLGGDYVGV